MKDNKNGFTLVELILCIAIIAALGIIIGLNSNKLVNSSKINSYEQLYNEIFDAALVYSRLSDIEEDCSNSCNIRLNKLVEKGLLDKNVYDKNNPVYFNEKKFQKEDVIYISKSAGIREVIYKCNSNSDHDLSQSKMEDYTWGECN